MISLSRRTSAVVRWPLLLNEQSQRRLFGQIADLGHPSRSLASRQVRVKGKCTIRWAPGLVYQENQDTTWSCSSLRHPSFKLDCARRDGVFPARWILHHTTNMERRNYGSSPGFHIPKITGHRASRLNGSADKLTPIQRWLWTVVCTQSGTEVTPANVRDHG
ncbi:hypothetical protein BDV09DRAFT_119347 [Aspergillus tetrazonus]